MSDKQPDPDALAADGDDVPEGVEPPTEEELAQQLIEDAQANVIAARANEAEAVRRLAEAKHADR